MVGSLQISFATMLALFCIAIATGLVTDPWIVMRVVLMAAILKGMLSRK